MSQQLQDRVMIFHNYADCPGIIVSEPGFQYGPDSRILRCAECNRVIGNIEAGALDQLIELAEKGGAKRE